MLRDARLYAILDLGYVAEKNAVESTRQLLAGGADLLQLRAKGVAREIVSRVGALLRPLCREAGVPFILNDDAQLAAELDADGVHIGQDDGSLAEAKSLFESKIQNSKSKILFGRSTHSLAQARAALAEGFDYIGFGPLFPTPTKLGRPGIGLDDIHAMEREVGSRIPAFCIGGIQRANLGEVLAAGARRVVIVSDLLTASDIAGATAEVVASLHGS